MLFSGACAVWDDERSEWHTYLQTEFTGGTTGFSGETQRERVAILRYVREQTGLLQQQQHWR